MRSKTMVAWILAVTALALAVQVAPVRAQEEAPAAAEQVAPGLEVTPAAEPQEASMGFFRVVAGSGALGVVLWLALAICSVAGVAMIVDSFLTIRPSKISPQSLTDKVRAAMQEGDVMKALSLCQEEPGPMSNILQAGFSNVEEGFEAIQDSVGVAADMESEQLLQRVTYLNVVGNLAPMLGLLGTVQGMIFAFATLATQTAGAAQQAALAMNISQALFTTAAGLCVAVPAVGFFYFFKNRATKIILNMEALTMDLIKVFRNVEVVSE